MKTLKRIVLIALVAGCVGWLGYRLIPFEIRFFMKESTHNYLRGLPYYVDKSDWNLVLTGETDGFRSLSFEKNDNDTTKHIVFSVSEQNEPNGILWFTKEFSSNGREYTLRADSKDTIFCFYVDNKRDTIFSVGEYWFKFTRMQLDTAQREYYLLYRDSLNSIHGDNLPELPQMNTEERRRFARTVK